MYDIRINKSDSPVIIYGWEIPRNAVYNADPEEPFICLYPSQWHYDEFIWLYTDGRWHFGLPSIRIRDELLRFFVNNHINYSRAAERSEPKADKDNHIANNIKFNGGNSSVKIHGWEIPQNAIYCVDSEEPFVCLYPSPEFYDSYIWRYTGNVPGGGWKYNGASEKIKAPLLDYIVSNHLHYPHDIKGAPPGFDIYDIKINKNNPPVIIHGWKIPKNSVYNADLRAPFVCLYPSKSFYASNIWWYKKNESGGRWQHYNAPERLKEALLDFIVSNHLDCSHVIQGAPPRSVSSAYNIKINKAGPPVIIYGWEIPKNAAYCDDPEESFVCLYPYTKSYESNIWWYGKNKSGKGWNHNDIPKRIKEALYDFIVNNQLDYTLVRNTSIQAHKKKESKMKFSKAEETPKKCIICGQPSFMGTVYCYNCYCQYVEKLKE